MAKTELFSFTHSTRWCISFIFSVTCLVAINQKMLNGSSNTWYHYKHISPRREFSSIMGCLSFSFWKVLHSCIASFGIQFVIWIQSYLPSSLKFLATIHIYYCCDLSLKKLSSSITINETYIVDWENIIELKKYWILPPNPF